MLVVGDFTSYQETVPLLLDQLDVDWSRLRDRKVVLKPNLVSDLPNPMTTNFQLLDVVAKYIQKRCEGADIIVLESCPLGATNMFKHHGYVGCPYPLIDVDRYDEYYESQAPASALPYLLLPRVLMDAVLVSIANMKEHSSATFTGTVKNLMGIVPTKFCTTDGLYKDKFHTNDWKEVAAIQDHKPIDLAVLDGSIGGRKNEFRGVPAFPPIGKIVIGTNAFEADQMGAQLLGIDPGSVPHLSRSGWLKS
jgi:uncharacterized protein (DUF362 family)